MNKNFYKILFIFLIFVINLQANNQTQNANFQEQIANLKIEVSVLKTKLEFYDKRNSDNLNIHSIVSEEKVSNNLIILELTIVFFGILIIAIIIFFKMRFENFVKNETQNIVQNCLDTRKEEIIQPSKEEEYKGITKQSVDEKIEKRNKGNSTFEDWQSKALKEYSNGKKEKSIEYFNKAIVEKSSNETISNALFIMALISNELKDNEKVIKYYKMAIEKDNVDSMYNLASLYKNELKDNEKAIKYYKMAIEKEHVGAMNNLALLYHNELKDNDQAIKYYKMAIEKEHVEAMNNLALLYNTELKDNNQAIKYYKMAIEKEHVEAINNLALLYHNEVKDNENAIKYYKMAIKKDNADSMYNLALLYKNKLKDYENAIKYYKMAVEKGIVDAMNNLAYLYYEDNINKKESLNLIKKAVSIKKDFTKMHTLSMIEIWSEKYEESIKTIEKIINDYDYKKFKDDMKATILFFIAKEQYSLINNLFEKYPQLKDDFNDIYFTLQNK
jgi:TPR repeat protein